MLQCDIYQSDKKNQALIDIKDVSDIGIVVVLKTATKCT